MKKISRLALICLGIVLICSCSKIDVKKFEGASRSAKSMEGACAVGINYYKFTELLQGLAAEVNILKDQVKSKKEKELADLYFRILDAYKDSADLWRQKIESSKYDFIPKGSIVLGGDLEPLVKKYRLDKEKHEGPSGLVVVSDESIQVVWKRASKYIRKADDFMAGRISTSNGEVEVKEGD